MQERIGMKKNHMSYLEILNVIFQFQKLPKAEHIKCSTGNPCLATASFRNHSQLR